MVKAVFFDIDGTLLDHSPEGGSQMPASTRRALKALGESGVGLYIASGRIPGWVTFLAELYPFDGYVTVNGQLATDRAGQVLHRMAHREEDIRRLVELYQKEPFACILIEEEETFALGPDACIRQHFAWAGLPAPALYDIARLKDHPVLQFCMYTPVKEAQRLLAPLEHIEITSAGGDMLDVIPQGGGQRHPGGESGGGLRHRAHRPGRSGEGFGPLWPAARVKKFFQKRKPAFTLPGWYSMILV